MEDYEKKKIYDAARKVCDRAVWGWDYEIDYDNFEEIVDEELIAVIDKMFQPVSTGNVEEYKTTTKNV